MCKTKKSTTVVQSTNRNRDKKNRTQPLKSSSSSLAPLMNRSSSFKVPITNKASCLHLEFPGHLPTAVLSFGLPSHCSQQNTVPQYASLEVKNEDGAMVVVVSDGCGGAQNCFLNHRPFEPHLVQVVQRFWADFSDLMPIFKFSDFRRYLDQMGVRFPVQLAGSVRFS